MKFILLLFLSFSLLAENHYYVSIFDSHNKNNKKWDTHSFASFVELNGQLTVIDTTTISWLPEDFQIHLFDIFNNYTGKNKSLLETLDWIFKKNYFVERTLFLEIKPELYFLAKKMSADLSNGKYKYKVINILTTGLLQGKNINCLQGIGLIDPNIGWNNFTSARGQEATILWLKTYEKYLIKNSWHSFSDDDFILAQLGIDSQSNQLHLFTTLPL